MRIPVSPEELAVKLPVGFHLEEEEDILFLLHGNEEVATFLTTGVNPAKIEKAAQKALMQDV